MDKDDFFKFAEICYDELIDKGIALQREFGITGRRWRLDTGAGVLIFEDSSGRDELEVDVVPIGSRNASDSTWLWSWANASLSNSQKRKSLSLKELALTTKMDVFRPSQYEDVPESLAWKFAAMGVRHLSALGVHVATAGDLSMFLAIERIKRLSQG